MFWTLQEADETEADSEEKAFKKENDREHKVFKVDKIKLNFLS